MRITAIKEKTVSISSEISNAFIDFSKMNVSVVEITTDVIRNGKPVKGYGFNSNGRYAQGCLLRERFIPRILQSSPDELLNNNKDNFDPFKIWNIMMTNGKRGGHGERYVAVVTIDMALWDIVSKIEEKPLFQFLADAYRYGDTRSEVFVYAAGGYYRNNESLKDLEEEIKKFLDIGYSVVKMKIGGTSIEEDLRRIETVLAVLKDSNQLAVDANGRFDYETAYAYSKALSPFKLRWFEEMCDPLDYQLQASLAEHYPCPIATGENLFSHQDVKNLLLEAIVKTTILSVFKKLNVYNISNCDFCNCHTPVF